MILKYTFAALFAATLVASPAIVQAQSSTAQANLLKQIAALQAQLAALKGNSAIGTKPTTAVTVTPILPTVSEWSYARPYSTKVVDEHSEDGEAILDDWEELTVYTVKNGEIKNTDYAAEDNGYSAGERAWQLFRTIAGDAFIAMYIDEYMTYDLPDEPSLAFVEHFDKADATWKVYKAANRLSKNGSASYTKHARGWGLAVNVADNDYGDPNWTRDHVLTLLHEYAHVLTLNEKQVNYDAGGRVVGTYCSSRGTQTVAVGDDKRCTKKGSYLGAFIAKFWMIEQSESTKNFVTEYAATSATEDIAESFTSFILEQKPASASDIADQKILFFYDYPELVSMRAEIRANIGKYFK